MFSFMPQPHYNELNVELLPLKQIKWGTLSEVHKGRLL